MRFWTVFGIIFFTYSLEKYTTGQETELVSDPFNWRDRGKDIEGNTVPEVLLTLK